MRAADHFMLQRAIEAIQSRNHPKALSILRTINDNDEARCFESLELEALAYRQSGDDARSLEIFEAALDHARDDEQRKAALTNLGKTCLSSNSHEQAQSYFERSLELDPGESNFEPRLRLCELHLHLGKFAELEREAPPLISFESCAVEAHCLLILGAIGRKDRDLALSRLSVLEDRFTDLSDDKFGFIVGKYILLNAHERASSLISRIEERHGNSPWVLTLNALLHSSMGEHERVVAILTDELLNKCPNWIERESLHEIRGKAHDKLGNHESAFRDFTRVAEIAGYRWEGVAYTDTPAEFRESDIRKLPAHTVGGEPFIPVFMYGFPRSGTTLLDTILDTQETVETLSETGSLGRVAAAFSGLLEKTYPSDIPSLTENEIATLKNVYFDHVRSVLGEFRDDTVIVDKTPLHTIHLPLILTLFPDARLILSLRHPLDVCLSNFQQNYVMNTEMIHFITLEGCFHRYRQIFELYDEYLERYTIEAHQVRYEDLINDMQAVTEKLFGYLDLQGDDRYLRFDEHARSQAIRTSSSSQVTQPLYTSSCFRWKNYQRFLEPHIPIVEPYIEKFGYSI